MPESSIANLPEVFVSHTAISNAVRSGEKGDQARRRGGFHQPRAARFNQIDVPRNRSRWRLCRHVRRGQVVPPLIRPRTTEVK